MTDPYEGENDVDDEGDVTPIFNEPEEDEEDTTTG